QSIPGTKLTHIANFEKVPGLSGQRYAWVQLHPLSKNAAALLLKEPVLGKDFSAQYTTKRRQIAVGQRFYYLEISGARLKVITRDHRSRQQPIGQQPVNQQPTGTTGTNGTTGSTQPAQSGDIQGVINFIKSEIRFNYYFSEEDAKAVVEKLNKNDFLGAALSIRQSVKNVLHEILLNNIDNKVKIIHEALPEMYLEYYNDPQEHFAGWDKAVGVALNAGKEVVTTIIEKLIEKLSEVAYQALANFFKARAAEFKQAQAEPADGVTVKIIWTNIPGMSAIRSVINAIRGKLPVGNLSDLTLPSIPAPEIQVIANKKFD
ncbi:MAG: hypothetical protein ICV51_09645, partial [Flavisolibacter sp.]|nr:hypothetical protein [Flavisolibacter sp.]